MMEPILGIVLACEMPLICDGVAVRVSERGTAALGVGVREWWLAGWCCCGCWLTGAGAKSRGSIGVEEEAAEKLCCCCC